LELHENLLLPHDSHEHELDSALPELMHCCWLCG
jgi:hypothetical protein